MENINIKPDIKISIKQSFGIDSDMEVDAFSKKNDLVPDIDKDYIFDISSQKTNLKISENEFRYPDANSDLILNGTRYNQFIWKFFL